MCRQAATKLAAVVCLVPHGYQSPFISWPKLSAIGSPKARTALAKLVMYASLAPSAIDCADVSNGSQAA